LEKKFGCPRIIVRQKPLVFFTVLIVLIVLIVNSKNIRYLAEG